MNLGAGCARVCSAGAGCRDSDGQGLNNVNCEEGEGIIEVAEGTEDNDGVWGEAVLAEPGRALQGVSVLKTEDPAAASAPHCPRDGGELGGVDEARWRSASPAPPSPNREAELRAVAPPTAKEAIGGGAGAAWPEEPAAALVAARLTAVSCSSASREL